MHNCVVRASQVRGGCDLRRVTEHMGPRYTVIAKSSKSEASKSIRTDSGYEGSACSTIEKKNSSASDVMSSDESMCAGKRIVAGSCGNASMKSVCVCGVSESKDHINRDAEKQATMRE